MLNVTLCVWISIAADDTTTLVAIAVLQLSLYFIVLFALDARFSTNTDILLFVKWVFCFYDYLYDFLSVQTLARSREGSIWGVLLYCIVVFADNMPVTWCYRLEDGRQYCSTGFPMGCYVRDHRNPEDICMISVCCNITMMN